MDAVSDSFAREVAQLFVVGRHSRQQGLEAGLGPLDGPAAVDLSPWSSAPSSRSGQGAGPSSDGISLRCAACLQALGWPYPCPGSRAACQGLECRSGAPASRGVKFSETGRTMLAWLDHVCYLPQQ